MQTYRELVARQKAFFATGKTKELAFRLDALSRLQARIQARENDLVNALRADLNKSEFEAYSTEIGVVLAELSHTLKHLHAWAKPRRVKTPVTHFGSKSYVLSEPYGVALIISPWNYPLQLALAPLIGALAAGNCAIVKPSEFTPKTSEVMANLLGDLFPPEYVCVVQGDAQTSQALLKKSVDYIFFTGSVSVGKVVMEAAANNLTPVTLELGGKSPCIVHEDANLKLAAKRIAWGKYTNAGQTCIAPDYLYVHKRVRDEFLDELKQAIQALYGQDALNNPDFTHIVSKRHYQRLASFLDNGEVFFGGRTNLEQLAIEPTVLTGITWDDPVMQEEIFGPILPVLQYDNLSEVAQVIQDHPKPLAFYLFTEDKVIEDRLLREVSFGGGCINDTLYHFASPHLPFGGVGNSGMGAYHGKDSFDVFSHRKSVLKQTTRFDIPFRYPNVKDGLKRIKWFLK